MDITLFDTIDSTNSYALRLIDGASSHEELLALHGKVFAAKEQTAGRGRMNRPFYSPEKTGIYFSMIYVPGANCISGGTFSPAVYTATAGVCVCRVLENMFGVKCFIKWVNDIYIEDKKVCGILTEGRIDGSSGCISAFVVGIGINLVTSNFPEEIKNRAGRVLKNSLELKDEIYRQIPQAVFEEFLKIVDENPAGNCAAMAASPNTDSTSSLARSMAEYKARSNLLGKTVTVSPVINSTEGVYEALVTDITDNALLEVQLSDGTTRILDSGEVSIKL
ncbi:MAG: biotin--[acetyl-CoA-carboxylase] ligase [Treponema sp.]|nr:biotin--[acetyl-CoA-carboxylase] ligase [Treponema sp.]